MDKGKADFNTQKGTKHKWNGWSLNTQRDKAQMEWLELLAS
jgi:hypothetical protein